MKKQNISGFVAKLSNSIKNNRHPLNGQLELTYRCNLNCIHCYCKGIEDRNKELNSAEWKKIIDEIHKENCLELCFSGGEPLIREDFLEIYAYAKAKGFIITIFTNGTFFTKEMIKYLAKSPPVAIEITLNGIIKDTYEKITQTPGSFTQVMQNIKKLAKSNLHIIIKSNCLKENKHEIAKIKAFTQQFFGQDKKRFKYDPIIFPRLNGDKTPCKHRLSPQETIEFKQTDPDIWNEYKKRLCRRRQVLKRSPEYLYHCDSWTSGFFINPYGLLRFCDLLYDYTSDFKKTSFKEGFYNIFPQLAAEKFKTDSKCRSCRLRMICYYCPGRAYLETGNKEGPVEYFCAVAKEDAKMKRELFN